MYYKFSTFRFAIFYALLSVFFTDTSRSVAQSPTLQWAHSYGGTSSSDYAWSHTNDKSGNILVTGFYSGTVDFDPGPAVVNRTSNGDDDIFVQKLDNNGNFLWVKTIGGSGRERAESIAIDYGNNIVIAGEFEDTVDFDPGPSVSLLTGIGTNNQYYVLKLDPTGNFIWVKACYNTGSLPQIEANSLDIDQAGSIYLTGYFRGSVDFDPGPDSARYTGSLGGGNLFVQKIDQNGDFNFVKVIAGSAFVYFASGRYIKVDDFGNVYVTGVYGGQLDFDPGPGIDSLQNDVGSNGFVLKIDTGGVYHWTKEFGNLMDEDCYGLDVDPQGNVYITGSYSGTVDFDPGSPVINLTASQFDSTYHACFLLKLNQFGNFEWANSIGPTGSSGGNWANSSLGSAVATDALGNIYLTGVFLGSTDLDPGPGVLISSSNGSVDFFVEKLRSDGTLISAASFGAYSVDIGISISVDNSGAIFCSGIYRGQVDFDPGPSNFVLTSNSGSNDYFVCKLQTCNSTFSNINLSSCGSLVSPSTQYTWSLTGIYNDTIVNNAGCDSIITVDLSVFSLDTIVQSELACSAYTWPVDSQTYTSSGTYYSTLTSSNNCDSVIELRLNIGESFGNDTALACGDNYTSPSGNYVWTIPGNYIDTIQNSVGCDSIIYITLTLNNGNNVSQLVTRCFNYYWPIDSTVYYQSGNHTVVLINDVGCDSIVTLDLTIIEIDTNILVISDTIYATSSATGYQWLDCTNGYQPLIGETSQFFSPNINGSFAVQLTKGICVDTSSCVPVNWVGLEEHDESNLFNMYPNPARTMLVLDFRGKIRSGTIQLFNALGARQNLTSFNYKGLVNVELNFKPGLYLVRLCTSDNTCMQKRLIVE